MIVISDTNVLSSMAAGEVLPLLLSLFARSGIGIPPAVKQELQAGLERGNAYLEPVLQAIQTDQIKVVSLSLEEELLTFNYPARLGDGEREAIALAQIRKAVLLSNDERAIRYCQQKGIRYLDLGNVLRLLWTGQLLSQSEVRDLIEKLTEIEKLALSKKDFNKVFAAD